MRWRSEKTSVATRIAIGTICALRSWTLGGTAARAVWACGCNARLLRLLQVAEREETARLDHVHARARQVEVGRLALGQAGADDRPAAAREAGAPQRGVAIARRAMRSRSSCARSSLAIAASSGRKSNARSAMKMHAKQNRLSAMAVLVMMGRRPLEVVTSLRRQHYMQAFTQGGVYLAWGLSWEPVAGFFGLVLVQLDRADGRGIGLERCRE